MKLVVVSAGLSSPSSTRLLADRLAAAALEQVDAEVEVIELRDLATEIAQHFVTGFPPARLAAALDTVAAADGLIAVTPVFAASYSGLFKSFFDVIDKDALTGKPVLAAATGGTARHSLVTEHALRPLFTYLRALVLPTAVYAASEDWGEEGLAQRITRAGRELARFMAPSAAGPFTAGPSATATAPDVDTTAAIAPRSLHGAITSTDPTDGFEVVPFTERLAALRVAD
ncbi:hydroxymethylpyrimidine ABC transporter substrate-binding protein [Streptomyces sp. YC504]|uniref:Hydroxymethylpyrimidine ABC transporter substrate-binding protein n=1 Tax=Streptomyces mesophilus TaxID=1775132 RepID=A0A6G4XJG3_9ACTN|nr:CE1759 family FMN reductase [Streptomyces mesophilus]NGO76844.1 hydroxymethylpyrimidine ABC transporter substrate-binding protein [Streptomyces mesophilus]